VSSRIRVAAGVLRRDGRILACRRPAGGPHPGKWEFPGGKLEGTETAEACLVRELREELGIAAVVGESLGRTIARYPAKPEIELDFFAIERFEGEPDERHYADLRWLLPEELPTLDFLDGDREIVGRLAAGEDCRAGTKQLRGAR
jgi:8-oxo-dGTP diphosphatase